MRIFLNIIGAVNFQNQGLVGWTGMVKSLKKLSERGDRFKTAFTRCHYILKTVKNVTDRPLVHTKTAYCLPADFEKGRF